MTRNAICCRGRVCFGPGLMAHKTNQLVSARQPHPYLHTRCWGGFLALSGTCLTLSVCILHAACTRGASSRFRQPHQAPPTFQAHKRPTLSFHSFIHSWFLYWCLGAVCRRDSGRVLHSRRVFNFVLTYNGVWPSWSDLVRLCEVFLKSCLKFLCGTFYNLFNE